MGRGANRGRIALLAAAFAALLAAASTPAASAPHQSSFRGPSGFTALGGRAPGIPARSERAGACNAPVVCSTVTVPLDRTGVVPGSVPLHVEVVPAAGTPRGAIFLIAGGPGQGSAHVFGLDSDQLGFYRFLFPGYTFVAYDDRGTGDSGLLDCPGVQSAITADENQAAVVACAARIGTPRAYYSTAEHAEDLEAVRAALGFEKIGLYGVSYGTKLAQAYALAHPAHVERLLLDSVVVADQGDPYAANDLRTMPSVLDAFCSNGGCRAATPSYSADVATVANRLAAKPAKGTVLLANGKTRPITVDGLTYLATVFETDLSPGLAADLPAATRAARVGNMQPLIRLVHLRNVGSVVPSIDLSGALFAATVCRDGPFPWTPETPIDQRKPLLTSAVAALPPGSFGPFGSWAYRFGNADFCLGWPTPAGGAALGPGPLPDVPMLAVSGGIDIRTPTEGAVTVTSRFRQGQLLTVPGVGHSTINADYSSCAAQAVRAWMLGGTVAGTCPRPAALVPVVPAFPPPGQMKPVKPYGPLPTYGIVVKTLADAKAIWLTAGAATPLPGIFAGRLVPGPNGFTLTNYAITRGVLVSGTIRLTSAQLPLTFEGTLKVTGPAAATGLLGLNGTSLRGTLGGRVVGR